MRPFICIIGSCWYEKMTFHNVEFRLQWHYFDNLKYNFYRDLSHDVHLYRREYHANCKDLQRPQEIEDRCCGIYAEIEGIYTERQKKRITSSERHSLKSKALI